MKIAIDLRSLQHGIFSGIENYCYNVLEQLLKHDRQNSYTLFYNGWSVEPKAELNFINSEVVKRSWPNKFLALSTRLGWPKFEDYLGGFDVLWMPNLNHVALNSKSKLVLTIHDASPFSRPEFYDLRRRFWHASIGFKKLILRADQVIAVSEYTKQDLVENFGVPAGKITVTYLGVLPYFSTDLNEVRLREVRNTYQLPGEFVLYLGTLEPRKNVVGLIQAFDRLSGDVSLVIAGRPGWKYNQIFKAIKESSKRSRIQLLGFVSEADKPYLLKLAKVFAFPSFHEGFGLPVLEAFACGTPVVTSSVTSLPELAGSAALLVNPYRVDEISFALQELLGSQSMRDLLAENGLARSKQFAWEKTALETLSVLTK